MNVAAERKRDGEATLCFCLIKHNMSMLHGLAMTFYTICNTTCQHEHSHANPNAAMLNIIHCEFKQFCNVHHDSIMFRSFRSTNAHAPHCQYGSSSQS